MEEKKYVKPNTFSPILAAIVMVLSMVCWLNFGPLLSFWFYHLEENVLPRSFDNILDYLIVVGTYIPFFIALFISSNLVLKTPLRYLLSPDGKKYRYLYSLYVGLVYLAFCLVFELFNIRYIHIDRTPLIDKLKLLPFILVLTPMQSISEEILFRALPARFAYKDKLPNTFSSGFALTLISGLVFLLPHILNVEVQENRIPVISCIYYFLWGALAMALALYSGGFEAPVAMHIVNNLFVALIVNKEGSSMPTNAVFVNTDPVFSNLISLIQLLILFGAEFGLTYYLKRRRSSALEGKVAKEEIIREKEELIT